MSSASNEVVSLSILNEAHLEESLHVLIKKNTERIKKASSLPRPEGFFSTNKFMLLMSVVCSEHGLPKEVSYLAAEIFENFMQAHLKEMFEAVSSKASSVEQQKQEWFKVLERIMNQTMLRALSCVQVASKHSSHYKHITCHQVMTHLRKLGHKYSEESIRISELRVLKTIGFQVDNCTPLSYLDVLMAMLAIRLSLRQACVEMYRRTSLRLLDLVLIDKHSIYQTFADVITSLHASSQEDRQMIFAIQTDYVFMAASILIASSMLVDHSQTNQLISALEDLLLINSKELVDLATAIIKSFAFKQT